MSASSDKPRRSLVHRLVSVLCAVALSAMPVAEAFAKKGGNSNNSDNNSGSGGESGSKKPGSNSTSTSGKQQSKEGKGGSSSSTGKNSRRTQTAKKYPPNEPKPKKPPANRPPIVPNPNLQQTPRPPQPAQPRPGVPTPPIGVRPNFVSPPQTVFLPPRFPSDPPRAGLPPRQRQLPPRRVPSTQPPQGDFSRLRDREILIAMDEGVSDGDTIIIGSGLTLTVEVQYRSPLLGVKLVRLRIPDNRPLSQVIEQVALASLTDQRIIAVQPNYVFETTQTVAVSVPPSPAAPLPQYSTEKVRLNAAHRVSLGRNVRVAVIDTGMDSSHPELIEAVSDTFDAIGEGKPEPEAHGTAIAGIVAARQQIRGMAPDARVLAIRAFAGGGGRKPEATTLSLIKGLDWAATNNARVVNMSFAGPKDVLLLEAIEQAELRGLVMVAAAGNGGPKAASAYPAAYERVIAVTATDSDDEVYQQANRGSYITIAAPGVDILAPAPRAAYEISSGTSLAAAHISGIIALMLERKPTLTTEEIRDILIRTARDPDKTAAKRGLGAGVVDAAKAVDAAK